MLADALSQAPPEAQAGTMVTVRCRVLLAEDQEPIFLEGLRSLCAGDGFVVAVTNASGTDLVSLVRQQRPDVAVIAVFPLLPSTLDHLKAIVSASPRTRVLLLAETLDTRQLADAWRAGAYGAALRSSPGDELLGAVRELAAGGTYVCSPAVRRQVPPRRTGSPPLTSREYEVLALVAEGHSGTHIAKLLSISPKTANHHRERIRMKLGARSTADLVRTAVRMGLVDR